MQKIEQQQEIKNQTLKTNKKTELNNSVIFTRRYTLRFDMRTAEKIRLFCEVFYLDTSYFIVKTLIPELFFIQEDMEEDREVFASYFDLEKFTENHHLIHTPKVTRKNCVFEAEFHPLVAKPIEQYCEKIHWKPEKFIVNIIEYKIKDLFSDIKRHNFQFIGIYFDFSEIIKSINEICYNKLG